MSNQTSFGQKLKTYLRHPGSFVLLLLVLLGAVLTFTVLIFLIAYILLKGIPYIRPSLFSLTYTSENASLMPALINTVIMTLLALIIAVRNLCGYFPGGICKAWESVYRRHTADNGNTVRYSFYCIRIIRPSVFCKCAGLGFFPIGWGVYTCHYDSAIDYAYNGRGAEIGS